MTQPSWVTEAAEHFRAKRYDEARALYEDVLRAEPDDVFALQGAANCAWKQRRFTESRDLFLHALDLAPKEPNLWTNFGALLAETGQPEQAERANLTALAINPGYDVAYYNLGFLNLQLGRVRPAVDWYRRAMAMIEQTPQMAAVGHSHLIFLMDFLEEVTGEQALQERLDWDAQHGAPLTALAAPHDNDRSLDRPLRVGYVSADFFFHSAAFAFTPVLMHHDPYDVEVYCYSSAETQDVTTALCQRMAQKFYDVRNADDETVARKIREDRIDILVDLSGHSKGARTLTFARKPAPVQISAWGHAQGTGIGAMDYLIADRVTAPPACLRFYRERVIWLPSIIPYDPPRTLPAVGPLPARTTGHVTFGSFNRLLKVNDYTLDLWCRVLQAVPGSHLLLKGGEFGEPGRQRTVRGWFTARGIAAERIELRGPSTHHEHLAAYADVDLALDPFPHGGGITALEGLWMGVPMVAHLGDRIQSRLGASFLTTLGLPELIVADAAGYVEAAVRTVRDLDGLATLRAGLRKRMGQSVLLDHAGYTRAYEAALRRAWETWVREGK